MKQSAHEAKQEKTMIENSMEMILLGFCLFSVVITSFIVALEIRGDKKPALNKIRPKSSRNKPENSTKNTKEIRATQQLQNRILQTLDLQLKQLGYSSGEKQLRFLNSTLKSEHKDFDELTPGELSTAFNTILRVREEREMATGV